MSVIVDLTIFPVGKGESVSRYVAPMVDIIKESGLPYKLGPMGTAIEGEWEDVMGVVDRCFQSMRSKADRLYMTLKVDYRKQGKARLESKVASIKEKIGELR